MTLISRASLSCSSSYARREPQKKWILRAGGVTRSLTMDMDSCAVGVGDAGDGITMAGQIFGERRVIGGNPSVSGREDQHRTSPRCGRERRVVDSMNPDRSDSLAQEQPRERLQSVGPLSGK